jgi:hypothetical protein
MNREEPGPESLAMRIAARIDGDGAWSLSSDEAIACLGVAPVDYWRAVHGLRDRVGMFDAVDGFTHDSVGDLVTIAESLFGPRAEQAMVRSGVFIPHPHRVDLLADLFSRAESFVSAHEIRDEELMAMTRFAGSFAGALRIYLDEYGDPSPLVAQAAEAFAASRGYGEPGRASAARFLRELFSRHVVDRRALFAGLERKLREAAVRLGFADQQEEDRRENRPAGRLAWARGVFGLPTGPVGYAELRRRYRELIMRFHPDVNPAGLERCKDITAAYSLLAARTEKGVTS